MESNWWLIIIGVLFIVELVVISWLAYKSGLKNGKFIESIESTRKIDSIMDKIKNEKEVAYKRGYDEGYHDAQEYAQPETKVIKYETIYKKPSLIKVKLQFPSSMFDTNYEEAMEYVKKEIAFELGRQLVDTDKIYITQPDNPANFEKTFTATCYVMKGDIE